MIPKKRITLPADSLPVLITAAHLHLSTLRQDALRHVDLSTPSSQAARRQAMLLEHALEALKRSFEPSACSTTTTRS